MLMPTGNTVKRVNATIAKTYKCPIGIKYPKIFREMLTVTRESLEKEQSVEDDMKRIIDIFLTVILDKPFESCNLQTAIALLLIMCKTNNIILTIDNSEMIKIVNLLTSNQASPRQIRSYLMERMN